MQGVRFTNSVAVALQSAAIYLLLVGVEGCEERPTTVSGTILLDGRPMSVASNARGTVVFQPANGQGTLATGLIDSAGHFNLATGGSIEVPPGKYQVAVSVVQLLPKVADAEQGTELVTPAKYAAAHESGLEAEVAPGENRLNFNLVSGASEQDSSLAESPDDKPQTGNTPPANDATENK
jgi:hypothetical protein